MKSVRWLALTLSVVGGPSVAHASGDAGVDGAVAVDGGTRDAGDARAPTTDASLAPPTHDVGKPCTKDGDCAKGLTCFTSDTNSLGTGGPPGGLCTVACDKDGQRDCNRVDTGSVCASDASGQFNVCYEGCTLGMGAAGDVKCHGRADFGCAPTQGGGLCVPVCRGDYDCPGRACDPATGTCMTAVQGTLPIGSACDPSASVSMCKGDCQTLGNGVATRDNSFCSSTCILGGKGGCGQPLNGSGPPSAACVFSFAGSEGDGDLGECAELCDCDSDCGNSGFVCHDNAIAAKAGRTGACVPKLTFDGVTKGHACRDGGVTPPATDGGVIEGGAKDAGSDGALTPVSATGGCSCRTASRGESEAPWAFTLALAAIGWRRNARHTARKR